MFPKTSISVNDSVEGETIEEKIKRILENKEPISEGEEVIYTERKDGVNPAYDVRTDRFELAVESMDKVHKDKIAKREERMKMTAVKGGKDEENKSDSVNGSDSASNS